MNRKKLFIDSIEFKNVERTPIWLMRQAGRYQKEYLKIREKYDFLTMCKTPEVATEVTLLPLKIIAPDALILFSDILTAVEPLGVDLAFKKDGPVINNPIVDRTSFKKLSLFDSFEKLKYVYKTIKMIKETVSEDIPVFGFTGAPFTLVCYMVEGKITKNFNLVKKLMNSDPGFFKEILDFVTDQIIDYASMQFEAGADFFQIFDTWAGILSREDFEAFAYPYEKKIIEELKKKYNQKIFLFINGSSHLTDVISHTGADVLSLDWKNDIFKVSEKFSNTTLQGNLDPAILYGSNEFIENKVKKFYEKFNRRTGYIFNLGHGIYPDVEASKVRFLLETVKKISYENYRN